ncbi:uncharacterized protein LOC124356002 [Homalodisca vitripennis]|uniref:uncharacterized protein LOC124356002 n=1 Tax=Homalodisca vitripennis TaxID=197043 RepID=UPI001EE9FDD6|nr:uncharacterized protein LOC124356002 [Homalodisca vitripennis]
MCPQPLLILLAILLPWAEVGANKIDDMLPAILERLSAVQEVLAPLPKEVLEEAIYHTASYYIPIDSETGGLPQPQCTSVRQLPPLRDMGPEDVPCCPRYGLDLMISSVVSLLLYSR